MRSANRRRHATFALLAAGLLLTAGCGGPVSGEGASGAEELFLQTAGDRGADPFTESTAVAAPESAVRLPSPSASDGSSGSGRQARALPGSTPGLYGGAQALSSCDVERQVRLLTEDRTRSRAFAKGAGIGRSSVPSFLRGLTPVVLRTDIRTTSHGYRDGTAVAFQSLLQAGTAVMVDDRGMPRVRCVCGNPLRQAVPAEDGVVQRGRPWPGYRPDRVVVVRRAPEALGSLIIVNIPDGTWLERKTGTHGDGDQAPLTLPPYAPDADITDPEAVQPPGPAVPDGTPSGQADPPPPADCPPATDPAPGGKPPTVPPGCPVPEDSGDLPSPPEEQSGTPSEPAPPDPPPDSGTDLYPPGEDLLPPTPEQTSVELVGPGAVEG